MGKNTSHIKGSAIIEPASNDQKKTYKKRGVSENFFSNYQKYPVLINNYEKNIDSPPNRRISIFCDDYYSC